jgi:ribosomal protein S18 acetylase RimI-like enzyme
LIRHGASSTFPSGGATLGSRRMRVRPGRVEDMETAAALLLELPGGLRETLPDAGAAIDVARAAFGARSSVLSHRFGLVVEDHGELVGLAIRLPGRDWRRLRLPSGLVMLRAAGRRHAGTLVRRGRIQDRLIPPIPLDAMFVPAMAVVPERRGQGVGRLLLGRVIGEAAAQGLRAVALDVDAENEGAIRLYQRLGFLTIGERNGSTGNDLAAMVSVRMELPLPTG